MAVTSCTLDRTTRDADVNELNIGTYTLRYIVETDSTMGPKGVANGALSSSPHPLPSQWSTYSYQGDTDALSFARDFKIEGDDQVLNRWYITVTFRPPESGEGSATSGGSPIMSEPNPLARETVVWWDREVFTENILTDILGKPVVNKCNDLYPDEIQLERARAVLVVEFNRAYLSDVFALCRLYDGSVNSSGWTVGGYTFPARTALCREVSATPPQTEHGYTFFHISMRFVFKIDPTLLNEGEDSQVATWDYCVPEMGQFHWTKTGGDYDTVPITGHRKVTNAQKVVFLNSDGTRQSDYADAIHTYWRLRREVNFNDLPI